METGEGGGHDLIEVSRRDGFARALEMMRGNGTDEQTIRVYTSILDIMRLNVSSLDKQPERLLVSQDPSNPLASFLNFWEQPRLKIYGLPIVTGANPDTPTFILDANYHNNNTMQVGNVCIDDPTITRENGFILFRKPDGTPNTATRVEISPGNIGIPGGMYDVNPLNGETKELTTNLRQRIDDAFQVCLEYSRAVSESVKLLGISDSVDRSARSFNAEIALGRICKDWRTLDGKKFKDPLHVSELYQFILSGRVKRKDQTTVKQRIDNFLSRHKPRSPLQEPLERPELPRQ